MKRIICGEYVIVGVLGKGLCTTLSLWVNETLQCIFSLRFVRVGLSSTSLNVQESCYCKQLN
jgi:hypothetical protein